ncbi:MAG TPA: hypothetical protein VHA56_09280 [Mucilaginibacter sp.]|nr:hypothetical protein [Mucilaginibacter sp.]
MSSVTDTIISFLDQIGIKYLFEQLGDKTFLPGLMLRDGTLVIDREKLLYPGDLLHEAGHLATMPPSVRATMSEPLPDTDLFRGGELMTMAWSYAACLYLKLPPDVVFHPHGYKGQSRDLIYAFQNGNYLGLPMLQWTGMAYDARNAAINNAKPYPEMIRWLRLEPEPDKQ